MKCGNGNILKGYIHLENYTLSLCYVYTCIDFWFKWLEMNYHVYLNQV